MGKHELALNHAMSAVILLQEEYLSKAIGGNDETQEDEDDPQEESQKDRTAVLAIAYHNMGVEQEFLRSVSPPLLTPLLIPSTQQQS